MHAQSDNFEQQVIDIITAYRIAFPDVEVPAPEWITHWLTKYSRESILAAIKTLQAHSANVKARFTQTSVGRAMSTLLRAEAVRNAVASAYTGGRS
jgi:hypothetical protein